ncbi:hypothetical protein CHS0354_039612 [Potamilus streckersoni]|uniref:ER membrane protein complex subunit 6 n=1 Tax=Potamilus streckersoni TaxID=2493646 RepID=A0AAE0VHQ8_9BIVA|nr:hypothetical protein CHS0354_039612 [Potamilus streckersoni]
MSTTIAVKTKRVKKDFTVYNELAMRQNSFVLEYSRTSMSALSGAAAGILGLTGLYGFIFFFIMAFVLSFLLLLKAGSNWNKYFPSRKVLFLNGQFGGLFIFIWNGPCILKEEGKWQDQIWHLVHVNWNQVQSPFLFVHAYFILFTVSSSNI